MRTTVLLIALLFLTALEAAADSAGEVPEGIRSLCERIDRKLSSVDLGDCLSAGLHESGALSNQRAVIALRDIAPQGEAAARVLVIGGIHGDEYSSVTVIFKWLEMLELDSQSRYHWRVVPVLNPDGLLMPPRQSQRMNANGVDLNRNFPTPNWETEARQHWVQITRSSPRRYPGPSALSEPESAWLAEQIDTFQPDAVISVHAPHGIVDFDGPRLPPKNLGPLELRLLGTYPGSMGRYIGIHKGIPILTVELESAFLVPKPADLAEIWRDMGDWLEVRIVTPEKLASSTAGEQPALE